MWLKHAFGLAGSVLLAQAAMHALLSIWEGSAQAAWAFCFAVAGAWCVHVAARFAQPNADYSYTTGELLRIAAVGTWCEVVGHRIHIHTVNVRQYDADDSPVGVEEQDHLRCDRCGSTTIFQTRHSEWN